MAPKNKIPDRWLEYRPIKDVVPEARLIPFKTPLPGTKFELNETRPFKWTTFDLISYVHDMGYNLGLVIDFTNKYPAYYDSNDFTGRGVQFVKLGCIGHDVPRDDIFNQFCDIVDKFLLDNPRNNRIIGVHCTHGVNRTGYMVCKYLVYRLRYHPEQAVRAFAEARGYPIERENYIQALYK